VFIAILLFPAGSLIPERSALGFIAFTNPHRQSGIFLKAGIAERKLAQEESRPTIGFYSTGMNAVGAETGVYPWLWSLLVGHPQRSIAEPETCLPKQSVVITPLGIIAAFAQPQTKTG
jgi:hypothetical protein